MAALTLIVWGIAATMHAYIVQNSAHDVILGWQCFALGFLAIGALPTGIIWSANWSMSLSFFFLYRSDLKKALITSAICAGSATLQFLDRTVILTDDVTPERISFGPGVYLWIIAMWLPLVTSLFMLLMRKLSPDEEPSVPAAVEQSPTATSVQATGDPSPPQP